MGVMPPAAPPGLAFGFTGHSAVGLNVRVLIPESESFVFFFFFKITLWRPYSHTVTFTLLKCKVQWFLVILQCCAAITI